MQMKQNPPHLQPDEQVMQLSCPDDLFAFSKVGEAYFQKRVKCMRGPTTSVVGANLFKNLTLVRARLIICLSSLIQVLNMRIDFPHVAVVTC